MEKIEIQPIGIIRTAYKDIANMPIQPLAASGAKGHIELFPEYAGGLTDLTGFSHIILLYYFHKSAGNKLMVKPFMDRNEHGVFATRAPMRPNNIGISTVKLTGIKDNIIYIEDVDMLDESPLIDIKPFFAKFDNRENTKAGWLDQQDDSQKMFSDDRFKK